MKNQIINTIKLLPVILPFAVFSQTQDYSWQRKINKPDTGKFYSVVLTPEIVAHLKSGWNDIRILNISENDTTEVPYLLESISSKKEEKAVAFELINTTYDKGYSYLTLKINEKRTLNRIKLAITDADFDKWVKVEGSSDNKSWFTITERLRIVRFRNANEHFEYTTLDFPASEYAYYRLQFDNTLNKRLDVTGAYAFETFEKQGIYSELKINGWKQTENKKDKKSEIIIELPLAYRVDHITVKSNTNKDFYRNINIYRNQLIHTAKGDRENWYIVNTAVFSSVGSNTIECYDTQSGKLKIEISNRDDKPVDISEIHLFAKQCRLTAELPVSDNLYILYGKSGDPGPAYDLVHFKEKIPVELPELSYGPEQTVSKVLEAKSPLISNKNWLWAAMGVIMLIISIFSYLMLKKENKVRE